MMQAVEQSLKRLKTDFIDLYWVHIIDQHTPIDEVLRGLDDLVSSGKILYTGISDTPAWTIAKANAIAEERHWTRFNAIQAEYNLLERTSERDLIPMAEQENLSVLAWSPLAGGLLSGKYSSINKGEIKRTRLEKSQRVNDHNLAIADTIIEIANEIGATPANVSLAWIRRNPKVIPIIGSRKVHQLKDNLNCINLKLTDEHLNKLEEASKIKLGFPHDFIAGQGVQEMIHGKFNLITG